MVGFEPTSFGVGSNRSAYCATSLSHTLFVKLSTTYLFKFQKLVYMQTVYAFHVTLLKTQLQMEKTLTVGASITVWLVSSFISWDSTASLHTNNTISSFLVKSSLIKLETSCTDILPPMVSVLWQMCPFVEQINLSLNRFCCNCRCIEFVLF